MRDRASMPRIRLFGGIGTGLIIQYKSGVIYSNQTGGTACLHPELEGVFVPLRNDLGLDPVKFFSPETALLDYFEGPKHKGTGATDGLDVHDADFIDSVLKNWKLDTFIEVDRARLRDSHEAWAFVSIKNDEGAGQSYSDVISVAQGFGPYPRSGILTWCNSD